MTSTLSAILMEIVQKAMEAQSWPTTPLTTSIANSTSAFSAGTADLWFNSPTDPYEYAESTEGPLQWQGNADNGTTLSGSNRMSYWSLVLLLIPTFTVFGNLLVIISVVKCRSLHSPINYFILGLAIADMCVATAVMPFAVYVEFNVDWELGTLLCDLYCAADVTCSTASIFLLTVISFDRYVAATQPIRYANSSKGIGRVAAINLAVWLVSMLIASPMVLGLNNVPDRDETKCMFYNADFIIYSSTGSFCIPLVIIVYLYGRIYCVIRERSKFAQQRRQLLGAAARFSVTAEKSVIVYPSRKTSPAVGRKLTENAVTITRRGKNSRAENAKYSHNEVSAAQQPLTNDRKGRWSSMITARSSHPEIATNSPPHSQYALSSMDSKTSGEIRAIQNSAAGSPEGPANIIHVSEDGTSSASSSSCATKDGLEVCNYAPHIDLIMHLQRTSRAFATRHRHGDEKKRRFPFVGTIFSRSFGGFTGEKNAGTNKPKLSDFSLRFGKKSGQSDQQESKAPLPFPTSPLHHNSLPSSSYAAYPLPTTARNGIRRQQGPSSSSRDQEDAVLHSAAIPSNTTNDRLQRWKLKHGCRRSHSSITSSTAHSISRKGHSFKYTMSPLIRSSVIHNPSLVRNYDTFNNLTLRQSSLSLPSTMPSELNDVMLQTVDDYDHVIANLHAAKNDPSKEGSAVKANGTLIQPVDDMPRKSDDQQHPDDPVTAIGSHIWTHDTLQNPWYTRLSSRLSGYWRRRFLSVPNATVVYANQAMTGNALDNGGIAMRMGGRQPNKVKKTNKSQRKEKKATKTLAIVLGIFLVCWLPFFTLNLLNAVCIKLKYAPCQVGFLPFFLTTWLGYMNSLMNPIIYTIFNLDFRRAFKQILCPCWAKHRARRV